MNMKKKVATLGLVAAMLLTSAGATLAYFTDTDEAKNVFTVGNVDITLNETFDANNAVLMPGSKTTNAINKDVTVTNDVNSSDAWVRVKICIPAHLDVLAVKPENYEEIAAQNILHMNTLAGVETIWNIQKANWEAKMTEDKKYNEYTFYYNEILEAGETTQQLLDQVYLDSNVDYDADEKTYTYKGEPVDLSDIKILVSAEAIQADGFTTFEAAFAAFDAQANA